MKSTGALFPGALALAILIGAGITRPFLTSLRNLVGNEGITLLIAGGFLGGAIWFAFIARPWRLKPGRLGALAAAVAIGLGYAFLVPAWPEERVHILEYAVLGWSAHTLTRPGQLSLAEAAGIPLLFGLLVGGCDELLQFFLPDRVGDWRDVAFNLAGTAWGTALRIISLGARR